jgi:hypothetical protein
MAVQHEIESLDAFHSNRIGNMMVAVATDPEAVRKVSIYYSIKAVAGIAMLAEPINGDPTVFVAPSTLHTFRGVLGSGTDKLRARIEAQMFYDQVVSQAQRAVPDCLKTLDEDQRAFVQDALANWDNSSDEEISQAWVDAGLTAEQCQAALKFRDRFALDMNFRIWPITADGDSAGNAAAVRRERQLG